MLWNVRIPIELAVVAAGWERDSAGLNLIVRFEQLVRHRGFEGHVRVLQDSKASRRSAKDNEGAG